VHQPRGGLGFDQKPLLVKLLSFRVADHFVLLNQLHRDGPPQLTIQCPPDDSHPATCNRFDQIDKTLRSM